MLLAGCCASSGIWVFDDWWLLPIVVCRVLIYARRVVFVAVCCRVIGGRCVMCVVRCLVFVVCCLLYDDWCLLAAMCCWLLVVGCLFGVWCLMCVARCLLLVVFFRCALLFDVVCFVFVCCVLFVV